MWFLFSKWRIYLSQEAVYKHRFELTEAVHSVYALDVVGRIPRSIKDDNSVSRHEVDAQRSRFCWNEKEASTETTNIQVEVSLRSISGRLSVKVSYSIPDIGDLVKLIGPLLPQGGIHAPIKAVVINVFNPAARCRRKKVQNSDPALEDVV